jgi:phosphatidylinositol alpha-1,6-mannosyltransferase
MELVFSGEFPPMKGGIGTYIQSRCRQPPKDGLRVLAADCGGGREWDETSGLDTRRFPYRHGQSILLRARQALWSTAALRDELRRDHYRLVTANIIWPFGWAASLRKKRDHRVAVFCYGAELLRASLSGPTRWVYRQAMRSVDRYIAVSNMTANILLSQGWDRKRIRVIPPTIDRSSYHPGLDGSSLRTRWTQGGRLGPVLLTVCRLDDRGKGIDTMLRSLLLLRKQFPEILHVFVGGGQLRGDYERQVSDLGLNRNVIFAGRVADGELPSCYAACDVFVLASRLIPEAGYYEGYGIVYQEAMACGKPVVVSREAGFRDYVIDGDTGLLVDPNRPEEIARACADLLADPAASARMGRRGALFAEKSADWSALDELN